MDIKKILILGNSGFIGKRLEHYLAAHMLGTQLIGYSTEDVDLTDARETKRLEKDFNIETVVVMCSMVKKELGDNIDNYFRNLQMAVNVSRVLEQNPVKRFVYMSSAAVYGEEEHNVSITEQTHPCPTSYYGLAKCASEFLFLKVCAESSLTSVLVLRPPAVYGSGDRKTSYDPAGFIQKAFDAEPILLWGDGSELREFIYIDDLIIILTKLLATDFSGIVNVVSGRSYSFRDILHYIEKYLNKALHVEARPRTRKKVDHCFKNNLIKDLLADFRFTPLEEGIRRIIEERMVLMK